MLDAQVINKTKKINRRYILLDKPFDMCIIDYNWSNTEPEWIVEKMVWNTHEETSLRNNLRDGKYLIGIF